MKKIYTLATVLVASMTFAQNNISFEASEGFQPGELHGQQGWEVTLNRNDNPIKNQSISNENATDGTNSLKIDVDVTENFGWFAIYGASKTLSEAQDFKNLKVEFDVRLTKKEGSSFDFGSWGIEDEEFVPVFYFAFNAMGIIEVVKDSSYEYLDTGAKWDINKWYKLRAEINETEIKYFVDNTLIYTGANYSKSKVLGFNFLHDNFDGAAFIDNIKINDKSLATYEAQIKNNVKIYPNPAKDVIEIQSNDQLESYSIFNLAGQKVLSGSFVSKINVASLAKGTYILQTKTSDNKTHSTKLIKN